MKNWKTTAAAISGLIAIAATQATAAFDADPATVPDFALIIPAFMACIGLIFSKDASAKE